MSKVIAIIDRPKNCQECVFGICKYSLPLSTNRKGYYCQLKEPQDRVVEDFDFKEEVHLSDCPLRELPQKKIYKCHVDEKNMRGFRDGWNACIEEILKGDGENE